MSVTHVDKIEHLTCLSTDTKPSRKADGSAIPIGSQLRELDTGTRFSWDGATWQIGNGGLTWL